MTPSRHPFDLDDTETFARWSAARLRAAPRRAEDLLVEVHDPRALSPAEHAAIQQRLARANMAFYASPHHQDDPDLPRHLAHQFGLVRLDANWLADDDGISHLQVTPGVAAGADYIPYTHHALGWHTDGYYNPPERSIHAMVLHCVRDAIEGGENQLLDHELAYLLLRHQAPELVRALMHPQAMMIPQRTADDGSTRAAQAGPVFSVHRDARGQARLHMRYTARTRSIVWRDDPITLAAAQALRQIMAAPDSPVIRTRLHPGWGLICVNVLHDRSAFHDDPAHPRLLFRARYLDQITLG
ncbi:TauD/TfdA family dioxygenase [Leptothrix ochracea]|uniref:TauD/TfdA family dioxygenase n=1 Tax=Leptothrix ochracea TaxID=735331 RepID=UPI0034E1C274